MLNVVTPDKALDVILSNVQKTAHIQKIGLYEACGRVCANDIKAPENLPSFTRSTVDGLAVHSQDTFGCGESLPAMLEYKGKILMGQQVDFELPEGCCVDIPTGGMLPKGADAAVMIEYAEDIGDSYRYIQKPCAPFENVIRLGDDCAKDETVITAGTVLGAKDIAVLAALGIAEVEAIAPVTIGVISTGDEIIGFSDTPIGSQVRNVNSVMLASALKEEGCAVRVYPVVADNEALLRGCVEIALAECDCLLISGGSSVGERDSVNAAISSLGEIKFHGIAVKPGKPTMFACVEGKPVFGLPGHPAAAFFDFHLFVKPAARKMLGSNKKDSTAEAVLSRNLSSNHGRQEIVAVKLENGVASPLPAKSGAVAVLAKADGYIIIDRNAEGILKDSKVEVILF